jgi:xanthine dehydrogenase accessory factor
VQFYLYGEAAHNSPELPCGGRIQLCIEKLSVQALDWLLELQGNLHFQRPCRRQLDLHSGLSRLLPAAAGDAVQLQDHYLLLDYGSQWSLLLLGASPVAVEVARLGSACGYQVRLCDMREEFVRDWPLAEVPVEQQLSSVFVQKYANERCAVLALAHDPRVDDIGLMQALGGPGFYIGAMGSKRTSQKRRERLQRSGSISEAQLQRLHAPVGLNIGSKTPAEIAVAIMADIIRCRHSPAIEEEWAQESRERELCHTPQS